MEPTIRVVEIEGLDAEACFGTHLRSTNEVGGIKIVNVEKIADGVIRLEYVAGTKVVDYARDLENKIKRVSTVLGGEIEVRAKSLLEEINNLKNSISMYRKVLIESLHDLYTSKIVKYGDYNLIVDGLKISDLSLARELLIKLSSSNPHIIVVMLVPKEGRSLIEVSLGSEAAKIINANELLKYVLKDLGGRGGGKRDHATGSIPSSLSDELISKVRNLTIRFLENISKYSS